MAETCSAARFPAAPCRDDDHEPAGPAPLLEASARNDGTLLIILRRDLGDAVFHDVLAALDDEMEYRLRSVQREPWDWPAIRDDARAMLSLAAGFGFGTLAALSRTVLSACGRPPHRPAEVLWPYRAEVHRLRSTMAALRPMTGPEGGVATVGARPIRDGAS